MKQESHLIVCDEAHKMSASFWGGEAKYTKRFLLGRLLSGLTRHFLLLTATPHNGKEEDFQLFMSLVDQDRFEGALRTSNQSIDVSDVMRRLVKEDLLKFDGTPLFPERIAYTVNYDLSDAEAKLYTAVTSYVQDEFKQYQGSYLHSLNPAYDDIQLREYDESRTVGRVLGVVEHGDYPTKEEQSVLEEILREKK